MFTPLIRTIILICLLGISIYFYSKSDYISTAVTLLSGLLLTYFHFKYGTVHAAFQELKKENFDKAKKMLSEIKNPDLLSKSHKSYFHFIQATLAYNDEEWDYSYTEWTKALELGLRTGNDTSIVLLHLANIELERKNFKQANDFLVKLRDLKIKPLVQSDADRIQNEIDREQKLI